MNKKISNNLENKPCKLLFKETIIWVIVYSCFLFWLFGSINFFGEQGFHLENAIHGLYLIIFYYIFFYLPLIFILCFLKVSNKTRIIIFRISTIVINPLVLMTVISFACRIILIFF